ncbi:MAG: DUF5011 domain-containing protein [Candidatus Nomurabacteria bacterium]|nr:DUF5011 domain-containing protein [Candidatus Nomurabacteria bacterium]
MTANGGVTLTGGQSLTAGALSYLDLGLIVHNTTALQGLRLPQAASATPSNPTSGEGYLAWDAGGNQLIYYNGAAWATVGGGVSDGDKGDVTVASSGTSYTVDFTSSDGAGGTSTAGGLEEGTGGIGLLQGCADNEILKWSEGTSVWGCATDSTVGGIGADTLDFTDMADAMTLDASTSIAFGAGALNFTFTNDGSGNEVHNLSSTGDLIIQDNGTPTASFLDTGAITFAPTSGTSFSTTVAGAGTIANNITGSGNEIHTLSSTGDIVFVDGATTFATFDDTGGINFTPTPVSDFILNEGAGTNMQITATAAPTVDLLSLTNAGQGTVTDGVDGLELNLLTTAVAGSVVNSGLHLVIDPAGATEAGDKVQGIDIGNITNPTGLTTGIRIGSGFDASIRMMDSAGDFAGIVAPTDVTTSYTWQLPAADAAGCLKSDGAGTATTPGIISIAACGDTLINTYTSNSTWTKPANAVMVIVEMIGGGGGGGGGSSAANVVSAGGGGGGGGAYNVKSFDAGSVTTGSNVIVPGNTGTAAAVTDGTAGGTACVTTGADCTGATATITLIAYGGGGGGAAAVNAVNGGGGGGGGGQQAVGGSATLAAAGVGGGPNGGTANTTSNSAGGGGGGGTGQANGTNAGSSYFGGGGGAGASLTGGGATVGQGGLSTRGGGGGGAGGSCAAAACTNRLGTAGGAGGGLANSGGTGGNVSAGNAGVNGLSSAIIGGGGGGGGASNVGATNQGLGWAGGRGGIPGGGGGGGGVGGSNAGNSGTGGVGGAGGRGEVKITTLRGTGADLAEIYATNEIGLESGDVVAIDPDLNAGVKKTDKAYDSNVIGIISSDPGIVIGNVSEDPESTPVIVALSGRVPVKVNLENGVIHKGDLITPSSTPGEAMKAIKSGVIIGQSMTEYDGSMPLGYVVAFIKNTYGHGDKIEDVLTYGLVPELDENGNPIPPPTPVGTLQQQTLAYFNAHKNELAQAVDISELNSDRITAGLEMITPTLIADEVQVNNISASTGTGITMSLGVGGTFVINSITPEVVGETPETSTPEVVTPVITFDSLGNAIFTGDVTAHNINAEQITGMNVITDQLSTLEDIVNGISSEQIDLSALIALAGTVEGLQTDITNIQNIIDTLNSSETTQGVTLTDLGTRLTAVEDYISNLSLTGAVFNSLSVSGGASFAGGLTADTIGSIGDLLTLSNDTKFIGRPYFNKDTAGFAVVSAGSNEVEVTFDSAYLEQPIVNATITLEDSGNEQALFADDIRYIVTDKSVNGFKILLNHNATSDIKFSWSAFAVTNPNTFFSTIPENNNPPPPPPPPPGGENNPPPPSDVTPPVLTLNGDTTMNFIVGDVFTDPGATAVDDIDGDISVNIVVSGDTVDTATAGTYTIIYTVADSAGNSSSTSRTVIINSNENPI